MPGAHDADGKRLKARQKVAFQWAPEEVAKYAPGWFSEGMKGLCGRAKVLRVISPEVIRIDFRENMGLFGSDAGDYVECDPKTCRIVSK